MVRTKVKLAWISNDATRRSALKKRRKGLLKKADELSVLCGVDTCVVVYSPEERTPDVWPPNRDRARCILTNFTHLPESERTRKMAHHEAFSQECVARLAAQLVKAESANKEIELRSALYEGYAGGDFAEVALQDLWAVGSALDELIDKTLERMGPLLSVGPAESQVGWPGFPLAGIVDHSGSM